MSHKTLNELLSIQSGSINNLFSYKAKTYKGAVLQAGIDIKKYLKAGWVAQIPFDIKPRSTRQQYFYFPTREGAKAVDRLEDFKQKVTKSLNNAEHESMKFDVALSFIRNFPDYDFDFNYKADFNKLRPDILIKAKNIHSGKEFFFFVEIERKKEFTRIKREKLAKYKKFIKNGLFSNNKLPDQTKVLIVCSNLRYNSYLRPQQYKEALPSLNLLYKHFDNFINEVKDEPNKHFRFLPFPEFYKLHEPVWHLPSGEKVKILD